MSSSNSIAPGNSPVGQLQKSCKKASAATGRRRSDTTLAANVGASMTPVSCATTAGEANHRACKAS